MTFTEFQKRAYAAGVDVKVSGNTLFFSKEGVTVRVRLLPDEEPHYALSHLVKGHDIQFNPCTVAQASRALKLPRR